MTNAHPTPSRARDAALDVVVAAVAARETRDFHIGVVGYFIEGVPYPADGLTVRCDTTPNPVLTEEAFTCDAFFPPEKLDDDVVMRNGSFRTEAGINLVRVRLTVRRLDIWAIIEFVDRQQQHLFLDPETLGTRKPAFAEEIALWRMPSGTTAH